MTAEITPRNPAHDSCHARTMLEVAVVRGVATGAPNSRTATSIVPYEV
jgi:hypothetical protein